MEQDVVYRGGIEMEAVLDLVLPELLKILGLILGSILLLILNKVKQFIIVKTSKEVYDHAIEVAKGIYNLLEDDFADVEKAGKLKLQEMNKLLLDKFPTLTETELKAINKYIWNYYNQQILELVQGEYDETV